MIKEMEDKIIASLKDDTGWTYNIPAERLTHENGMILTVCHDEMPPFGEMRMPVLMRLGKGVTDAILERIDVEKNKTHPKRVSDPEFIVQFLNGEWPYTVDVNKTDVTEAPSVPYRHYMVEMRNSYRIYLQTEEDHLAVTLMY